MIKRIVWLLISCLMVLTLVLSSCESDTDTGGTVTTEDKGQTVTVSGDEDREEPAAPSVTVDPDKPQYGGRMIILASGDITNWNVASAPCQWPSQDGIVLEQILGIQREKGLAGTGETD